MRNECSAGGLDWCLGVLGANVAAPSHDAGDEGSISWKGSFILRTDRKGEIHAGPRSAGRRGRDGEISGASGRGSVGDGTNDNEGNCLLLRRG